MVQCILNFGWDTRNGLNKARTLQILSLSEQITFNPFAFKILQCVYMSPFVNLSEDG